jgi:hypothetical protein
MIWKPIGEAPANRLWWIIWDPLSRRPLVVTCRNNDGEFFEGDWNREVPACFWADIPELSGPDASV